MNTPRLAPCFLAIGILFCAACATAPPAAQQLSASPVSCRTLDTQGEPDPVLNRENPTLCGTAEQWQELDRHMALTRAGITCRDSGTTQEVCMTAEQWRQAQLQTRARRLTTASSSMPYTPMDPPVSQSITDNFPFYPATTCCGP